MNKKKKPVSQRVVAKKEKFAAQVKHPVAVKSSLRYYYLVLAGILAATFVVYLPALQNGFVWDDEFYILGNRMLQSINLKQLFSEYYMGNYHPLTMLSYSIEYHFFGLNEKCYHLVNIILHLANTALVFYSLFLLSKKNEIALVAALLFGVHPMHVESVAWVAERKDLLYTFFFLSSFICYLNYRESKSKAMYAFALLLFILSMLSKAMAACLPVLLLLTDYFKSGKLSLKSWLDKIPFVLIAAVLGVVAVFAQQSHHAVSDMGSYTLLPRIVFACYGFVAYIAKLIFPISLTAYYPYPVKGGNEVPTLYYIYPVILAGLIAGVIYSLRSTRKVLFGLGYFAITVFLVLQMLPVGDAIIADRYSYIPSIGIFYLAGEGFYWLWKRQQGTSSMKLPAVALLLVFAAFFSVKTYSQCSIWKNGFSLWNDVISHFQTIPSAYNNRGKILLENKKYDEALADFNKVVEIEPDFAQVYNNRGALLMDLKRYEESEKDFNRAVELQPQPNAYNNKGLLMMRMGRFDDALASYNKALELQPDFIEPLFNRGILFQNQKRYEEALKDYYRVVELKPEYIAVYNNIANTLLSLKRYDEALVYYDKAIALDPNPLNAYINKGTLFYEQKKFEEAIVNYSKAIELDPNYGNAYYNRGLAEYSLGSMKECCVDLQRANSLGFASAQNAIDLYCH